ncbi:MAG: asparagine synthetase B family protein [Bacteroidales bacterium]
MASFFLIYHKSVQRETPQLIDDSRESRDAGQHFFNGGSYFADDQSGCSIVADARIDYKQELAGKLGLSWNEAVYFPDSKFILLAYLKWGEACLSHLYGDFSFVIRDPGKNEIFCARDHFGCRPFYYVDQPEFLAMASKISAFKNIPGLRFELRAQYILDSICAIAHTDSNAAYTGINRLKPAHYIRLTNGQLSPQHRYWDLKINECFLTLTLEEASVELRERIIEAIRQRIPVKGQMGVELSGGLDSSAIASVLAKLSDPDDTIYAFTHSMVTEGSEYFQFHKSDTAFSKAVIEQYRSVRQFNITEEHSAGGYQALTDALHCLYKPINLHYAVNADLLFSVAAHSGTTVIFSGLGGDEGISYEGTGFYNELIGQGQFSKLKARLKSGADRSGWRFYQHYFRLLMNYYVPWITDMLQKDRRRERYRSFALQKHLTRKYQMRKRFYSSHAFPVKADVRTMQHFRLMYPHIPERIEETSLLAQQHGIEYRYPFLDVKLVEFFYSLPSEYKVKDGKGRYLFRLAMKEILPDKIRMRSDKGGNTIPNVFARVLKDEKRFREIIEESRLKNDYLYVDEEKLEHMLDSYKNKGGSKQRDYGLREFQSAMSVLILQKWQREGLMDTGIRC